MKLPVYISSTEQNSLGTAVARSSTGKRTASSPGSMRPVKRFKWSENEDPGSVIYNEHVEGRYCASPEPEDPSDRDEDAQDRPYVVCMANILYNKIDPCP